MQRPRRRPTRAVLRETIRLVNRLGLTHGEIYVLDLFHAERQTNASNFRFQTNLILEDALYSSSITTPFD